MANRAANCRYAGLVTVTCSKWVLIIVQISEDYRSFGFALIQMIFISMIPCHILQCSWYPELHVPWRYTVMVSPLLCTLCSLLYPSGLQFIVADPNANQLSSCQDGDLTVTLLCTQPGSTVAEALTTLVLCQGSLKKLYGTSITMLSAKHSLN